MGSQNSLDPPRTERQAEEKLHQGGTQEAKAADCGATRQEHLRPASPSFGKEGGTAGNL